MKKLLIFLVVVAMGVTLMSTRSADVTRTMKTFGKTQTYWKYIGVPSDTIMEFVQDTVEYPIFLNKDYPVQYYINCVFDTVDDNDNAVVVYLLGKVFEGEAWSAITNSGSKTISTQDYSVVLESIDNTGAFTVAYEAVDTLDISTITPSNVSSYYRYLMIRVVAQGDNAKEGVKLDNFEVKIWDRDF